MVEYTATAAGGVLEDSNRRDKLYGGVAADTFSVSRDGKTDSVYGFEDGIDKVDLTDFNVNWSEVQVKFVGGSEFMITIRGERTRIEFDPPPGGGLVSLAMVDEDDFIFAPGAGDPAPNIQLDAPGATLLLGSDQSDVFVMHSDNVRDVIKQFDPEKDLIDLSGFGITFADLEYTDKKPGKIVIKLGSEGLVVRDISLQMTSADFTEDMFIFI
ncbi:hypothetical protein GCM10007939_15420 [Amylibacter marinus]|uniref:Auto-transporter adhesin head GIN domain-containing protein n=1 Tax=Amylibacter marinus TaxID=1475483 RepID=A0ABQ5VVE4_9RHOB|nr:hypothetical protein [Amylibacter marinus]GLQ35259.1 hypothetical protein GCM10007939_15420 [Amylibacter marinus]